MCSCPLGMELGADNKTCQIQSYCAKHLKCSQKCEQDKYNVKCSCYEGWMLEADGESCRSLGVFWGAPGTGSSPPAASEGVCPLVELRVVLMDMAGCWWDLCADSVAVAGCTVPCLLPAPLTLPCFPQTPSSRSSSSPTATRSDASTCTEGTTVSWCLGCATPSPWTSTSTRAPCTGLMWWRTRSTGESCWRTEVRSLLVGGLVGGKAGVQVWGQ